jgi:hypothetical protein
MAAVVIPSTLRARRFVGLVAEGIPQVGDRGGDFGDPTDVDVGGLRAKPAILAAGS